jgi:hypothetical protein
MTLLDEKRDINGFVFNGLGDIIDTPKDPSLSVMRDTIDTLHQQGEHIKASRINRLMMARLGY